ncbi:hypothetical protein F5884DRAFT_850023 [Xylogone sp. PMI_703]|nr:hypothetical protein F5884DRAFT_850023 [Xylogone sp. PMI_703]
MESLNSYIEALNQDRTSRSVQPDSPVGTANDLGNFDQNISQDPMLNSASNLAYFSLTSSENFDESWFLEQVVDLGWLDSSQL